MRKLASIWYSLVVLLIVSFVASSCVREDLDFNTPEEPGTEKDITVTAAIPAANMQSMLRSMSDTEENTVRTIDVLVFRVGNDGKEYYDYSGKARKITPDPEKSDTYTFTVTVREKTNQQRLVIITNTGTKIADMLNSGDWKNTEKNAMLSGLEFALAAEGDKWNTSSNYTAFPMWGESGKVTITSTTSSLATIPLLRMIAKINVQLDESKPEVLSKFKLTSVRLYNTNTKGAIVPNSSVVSEGTGTDRLKVTGPTIPAGAAKYLGPLVYTDFDSPGKPDIAIRNAIYTFETKAAAQHVEATCLVIGGLYEEDTKESYYRVDFLEKDNVTYRDILRNNQYVVNIIAVKDRGHDTPEDAFDGKSVNMEAEILNWNENGIDDIIFDGQFFLSVSQDQFNFSIDPCQTKGNNNVLTVLTDYIATTNSGWSIVNIESLTTGLTAGWLTITDEEGRTNRNAHGDPNKKTEVILTYPKNTTGADRSVKITFAAGRLRYSVTITQNILEGTDITLTMEGSGIATPDTLVFNDNLAQHVVIDWTPSDENLVLYQTVLPGYTYAHFTTNSIGVISGDFNHLRLAITPPSITTLPPAPYVGYAKLVFTVSNGVNTTEKVVILKRIRS
ncbi:hypothetical protein FACS189421_01120 [Bacteroidia bacterium]|nr:hypothetical protein FACS189421_01120 [Bacteroidia bacterium]GHT04516.1 hypothetical protein FACS189423_07290 [Bacteroidia bacterium]GHT46149.1 hypothetical protein FACS189440_03550 [Bacteroidia bacterium]